VSSLGVAVLLLVQAAAVELLFQCSQTTLQPLQPNMTVDAVQARTLLCWLLRHCMLCCAVFDTLHVHSSGAAAADVAVT
jgi:hypothetical protein